LFLKYRYKTCTDLNDIIPYHCAWGGEHMAKEMQESNKLASGMKNRLVTLELLTVEPVVNPEINANIPSVSTKARLLKLNGSLMKNCTNGKSSGTHSKVPFTKMRLWKTWINSLTYKHCL